MGELAVFLVALALVLQALGATGDAFAALITALVLACATSLAD